MNTGDAIDKIKKLLRLSKSSNQHEAELALARAMEMSERYHLDLHDIDLGEDCNRIVQERVHVGARISFTRRLVLGLVNSFFRVTVIFGHPKIALVGEKADIEIATYAYEFLVGACSRATSEFARQRRGRLSKTKKCSFVQGFIYGVSSTLRKTRADLAENNPGMSLAIRTAEQQRNDFIGRNIPTKPIKFEQPRTNRTAIVDGYIAGQKTKILPAVRSSAAAPIALPPPRGQMEMWL